MTGRDRPRAMAYHLDSPLAYYDRAVALFLIYWSIGYIWSLAPYPSFSWLNQSVYMES